MPNIQAPSIDRAAIAFAMSKACNVIGGQAKVARILKVSPPLVNQWCKGKRIVLSDYCPVIERETRAAAEQDCDVVTCEQLRPDVEWGVLRARRQSDRRAPSDQAAGQGV